MKTDRITTAIAQPALADVTRSDGETLEDLAS